jgi:hypothetical protein
MRRRFAIRYGIEWIVPSLIIGPGPGRSWVEVDDKEIRLHMGLALQAAIPRRSISGTARAQDVRRPSGMQMRATGRWILNTAGRLVMLEIDPPARIRAFGITRLLRQLGVSLRDPDGFLEALNA